MKNAYELNVNQATGEHYVSLPTGSKAMLASGRYYGTEEECRQAIRRIETRQATRRIEARIAERDRRDAAQRQAQAQRSAEIRRRIG